VKLPSVPEARVEVRKLTGYLLDPAHPSGRHKAAWLSAFGFTRTRWEDLRAALLVHAKEHEVATVEPSPFGTRYVVEGPLETPDGRKPIARTIWFVEAGDETPRFVTAYPVRRRSR